MKIKTGLLSERGGRSKNEDFCSYREVGEHACFVLADGLGGHAGGELASRYAVEGILNAFADDPGYTPEHIDSYLLSAQEHVKAGKTGEYKFLSLKTTLVIFITDFKRARWAHIGDSRLYRFSRGKLVFQTRDHSVPQMMVNAGEISLEQIREHEDRSRLTRVFDDESAIKPEILEKPVKLKRKDTFLLCTDGLWEYIWEDEMRSELKKSAEPDQWLRSLEGILLSRVGKDHDNYSAISIAVT